jgi:uncharacterized protein
VFESLLVKLGGVQARRPLLVVIATLLTLVPTGWAASHLSLRTAFSELLPDSKPSVIESRRVGAVMPGNSTLTLVVESDRIESLKRFVDAVKPRIEALGPDFVAGVDTGPRRLQEYFEKNKHFYADIEDLRDLRSRVVEQYDAEIGRRTGMDLGLDEEDDDAPKRISVDDIIQKFEKKAAEAKKQSPGTDGYYIGEGGKFAALLISTPLGTGDQGAFELQARVGRIAEELRPKDDASMRFGFTGNLITSAEQHRTITNDLTEVGAYGVAFILTIVFLFFMQVRTLLAMTVTVGVGCVWAFGAAAYTVGYLNTASGFLASIIAGNGINFGIIYMARYLEARRTEGLSVDDAVLVAHRGTWSATLSAAVAAGVAYGSLSVTDFRGFKHFGIIGGLGMLLCWVATYLFLPAVLVITERIAPLSERNSWQSRFSTVYGRPFAYLVERFPRGVLAVVLALGVAGAGFTVRYFSVDPMEYDLGNIRNDDTAETPARLLEDRVDVIVGRLGQDGRAIVVDRLDQVAPLVAELDRRRAAAPADNKPFQKVVSIFDLLPDHQQEKISLLAEIKDRVLRAHQRHFVDDSDWARLEPHIPNTLAPIGIEDLPEELARPFTQKDGSRGKIVYIVPSDGKSVYDARYLMHWADSFREVKLPNGEVIRGSGDPVIFSDMLIAISEEAPKAIALSFVGTLAVVFASLRGRRTGVLALGALLVGLSWLVAVLCLNDIKLNFLNFVALPIAIGMGADYALNMSTRRELEPETAVRQIVVETGGAVILCSLTTTLGYLALMLSINRAVRSFGLVAAVGEVSTLMAAVLGLPALWLRSRQARPEKPVELAAKSE